MLDFDRKYDNGDIKTGEILSDNNSCNLNNQNSSNELCNLKIYLN